MQEKTSAKQNIWRKVIQLLTLPSDLLFFISSSGSDGKFNWKGADLSTFTSNSTMEFLTLKPIWKRNPYLFKEQIRGTILIWKLRSPWDQIEKPSFPHFWPTAFLSLQGFYSCCHLNFHLIPNLHMPSILLDFLFGIQDLELALILTVIHSRWKKMKVINGFKFLTNQQFTEQTPCFSLIWGQDVYW